MKIKEIKAAEINITPRPKTQPRSLPPPDRPDSPSPMARYLAYRKRRSSSGASWNRVGCVITAEDGTFGVGVTINGGPVVKVINDHFARHLVGENCMATEKMFDMMFRMATPYGSTGIASYAISAVDLALWDLKGKLLNRPVYELLGGPQKESVFCYSTGFETEWYMELGFKATKLPLPYGPADGLEGLNKNEAEVARTRELIGDDVELMLDCWLSLDVEYTVRLAELLKPYRLKWLEDYLIPEDFEGFAEVRRRLPWQTLATGEHWYMPLPFSMAAGQRLVDIFQPDVLWAGGITSCVRICHLAEAAGISVITHGGMNYPYGQHLAFAMPAISWGERSEGVSPPGVPPEEMVAIPGTAVIKNGHLVPNDAPGFGIEVNQDWLESVTV